VIIDGEKGASVLEMRRESFCSVRCVKNEAESSAFEKSESEILEKRKKREKEKLLAEERARKEAEEKRLAEEKAKKDAADKKRAEEQAKRDAEAKRQADEKARRDAEAKRQADEKAIENARNENTGSSSNTPSRKRHRGFSFSSDIRNTLYISGFNVGYLVDYY